MVKYFLLALGFFLAITASSATSIDELNDAEIKIIQDNLKEVIDEGGFTCENYESKCGAEDTTEIKLCKVVMKKHLCENASDVEGIKQILKEMEAIDPEYAAGAVKEAKGMAQLASRR